MAKDKSKSKGNASEAFAKPSEASAGGDEWKVTDARDCLVLFTPLREKEIDDKFSKEPGAKQTIIVADAVVLTNKKGKVLAEPEEHDEVWVFQRYIQGSMREHIGERMVLGRVRNTETTTKAKSNAGGYYWELEDPTDEDIEIATAYRASLDPFSQKKGGKKEAAEVDEKPAKKKDKGKKKK